MNLAKALQGFTGLLLVFFVSLSVSHAAIELREFETAEQEELYRELIFELRCLVCQNQNLADSNAELAVDLRRQTYEMIQEGANKGTIVDYMVERYGEFVLYRPPFTASTILLWVGPFIVLVSAVLLLMQMIKARNKEAPTELSSEDQATLRSLLDDKDTK